MYVNGELRIPGAGWMCYLVNKWCILGLFHHGRCASSEEEVSNEFLIGHGEELDRHRHHQSPEA